MIPSKVITIHQSTDLSVLQDVLETRDVGPLTSQLSQFVSLPPEDDVIVSILWSPLLENLSNELRQLVALQFDQAVIDSAKEREPMGSVHEG